MENRARSTRAGTVPPHGKQFNGQRSVQSEWLTRQGTPHPDHVSTLTWVVARSVADGCGGGEGTAGFWAVGQTQTDGNSVIATLTEHFDGRAWSVVPSPNPGLQGNDSLDSVASAAGRQLFAVGADSQSGQCCLRTLALRHTTS